MTFRSAFDFCGIAVSPAASAEGEAVIPLTQEELAGLAGTSRATVNSVLRAEEKRGTLELRHGQTKVLAGDDLARRAR